MCPNCLSVHFSFIAVLFPITCEECANGMSTSCACFLLLFHWPFLSPRTTCRFHKEHMSHPFPVAFNPIYDSLRKKDKARATSNLNLHVPRWARNPPHTRIFEFTKAPFKRKTLHHLVTGKAILVGRWFLLFLDVPWFLNFTLWGKIGSEMSLYIQQINKELEGRKKSGLS